MNVDIHTHNEHQEGIEIQNLMPSLDIKLHENRLYSIGIHPWYAKADTYAEELDRVANLAQLPQVKAIGEIGLDRVRGESLDFQRMVFRQQIEIAYRHQKPIIVHAVHCLDELIAIKKEYDKQVAWVLHAFSGNKQSMQQLCRHGFVLSFGYESLQKNKTIEAFREIALDSFFLETDDSTIAIEKVYEKAAQLKNISLSYLQKIQMNNYNSYFS